MLLYQFIGKQSIIGITAAVAASTDSFLKVTFRIPFIFTNR